MVASYVVLTLYQFTNIKLDTLKNHMYVINLFQTKPNPKEIQKWNL